MWKMDERETGRIVIAGLLGLAVGDAIGVPVEFLDRCATLIKKYKICI